MRKWLVPIGLIALSLIPIAAGMVRLLQITSGAELTPDNARFLASPLPAVLHLVCSAIYCLLGAFQFAPEWRRRHPAWHRAAGRLLIPIGLLAALSALWMTQFYATANHDGVSVYAMRLVVGTAMVTSLCLGVAAIRRRDIANHQAWMMRAYALGLGAGTQVLTHVPWLFLPDLQGELTRGLSMGAGWVINVMVAEWLIARGRRRLPLTSRPA